ncbi:hypothetical protein [Psychrobacter immobilis]|uniref:hypothetical protein n=1 Tax=Psychrobacter immobilis TaxID=498 RepID=UPI00191A9983|nr:hypothetical protein [Psychrobacter immobilis]
MGQLTSQKRTLAHDSQASVVKSSITYKNRPIKLVIYAFTAVSTTTMLMGCQTTADLSSQSNLSTTGIDFSVADTQQNQTQGKVFNTKLDKNAEHYQRLFDQTKNPNPEVQAKARLLSAIRQHLATEHVSVSQANYHSIPYIKADSIDAGSSSFFRTLLELYLYNSTADEDINDNENLEAAAEAAVEEDIDSDNEENDIEDSDKVYSGDSAAEAVAAAVAARTVEEKRRYDEYGYDQNGYDEEGYDQNGYDEYGYDSEGYDEYGHDKYGYDTEGYDENGYNEYGNQRDDSAYESDAGGLLSNLSRIKSKDWLRNYEDMQASKTANDPEDENAVRAYPGLMTNLINMFIRTPEQVQAMNAYHYQYLTLNSVSHYKPKQKQLQSVYSYDYVAPTIHSSIQLPLALDFDKGAATIDPSALMPILALGNPEHTPLPAQMTAHTVNFGLPEAVTSIAQIPSGVIYDAVIDAVQNSMAELEPEYFSAVDIRDDEFAKEVGADRAVKVYFGSRQSGEMIGKIFKNISRSLQKHIDQNPQDYPDDNVLKAAIAKIELYNKGYQSADVGGLLQLIEAVSPISFNHINYYYLDGSDHLLAKQQRTNIGSDFFGSQNTVLNQTRYDSASFNKHPLAPLLAQSFGAKAPVAIDGNAWLAKKRQQKEKLEKARYARYDYVEATEVEAAEVEATDASANYADEDVTNSAE